jgi:phospholipase/lecithinase/hemolysin
MFYRAACDGLCLATCQCPEFLGVVAFGDSLSDLGNTDNDLGDDLSYFIIGYNSYYYDQGRWSDGPVWVENLAQFFGFELFNGSIEKRRTITWPSIIRC